jgi:hypothetical protein
MNKRTFAVIGLFAASTLMLAAPLAAKTGVASGFKGNVGMKRPFVGPHLHGLAHNRFQHRPYAFAHNRFLYRHHNDGLQSAGLWGAWWPSGGDFWPSYGTQLDTEPVVYQVEPTVNENITSSLAARVQSQHACSSEHVKVPSEQGGETTVTVIRC